MKAQILTPRARALNYKVTASLHFTPQTSLAFSKPRRFPLYQKTVIISPCMTDVCVALHAVQTHDRPY